MNTDTYKQKLETERDQLIADLEKIAFRDDENPDDWHRKIAAGGRARKAEWGKSEKKP